jgi:hypothetical protein
MGGKKVMGEAVERALPMTAITPVSLLRQGSQAAVLIARDRDGQAVGMSAGGIAHLVVHRQLVTGSRHPHATGGVLRFERGGESPRPPPASPVLQAPRTDYALNWSAICITGPVCRSRSRSMTSSLFPSFFWTRGAGQDIASLP